MKIGKIALIEGGKSLEREISLKTSQAFQRAFQELCYDYEVLRADERLPQKLLEGRFERVVIALHGRYGEDGIVQALCEYTNLPYTGSGVMSSALSMDKIFSKRLCQTHDILTSDFEVLQKPQTRLSFPVVLKPSREGSSFGVFICKNQKELEKYFGKVFLMDSKIFVEKYIEGKEITIAMVKKKIHTCIEIQPQSEFYDFRTKYTKGLTDYVLPADISETVLKEAEEFSLKVWELFDIRGFCRVDFIVSNKDSRPYFLEVNTLPGLTETSLLPKAVSYDGLSFNQLVEEIVSSARRDY